MAVIGDIYELKAKYRDQDQRLCENVFFYQYISTAADPTQATAQGLAEAWNTGVLTPLLALTPQGYTYYSLDVRNLFDSDEVYALPLNRPTGLTPGGAELIASFITGKITFAVDSGAVGKGRKMLTGFYETMVNNGVFNAAGVANLAVRGAYFLTQLVTAVVSGSSFRPVVVRRVRSGTSGNYTYRLPTSAVEAISANITSAVASVLQTSQVTRKD